MIGYLNKKYKPKNVMTEPLTCLAPKSRARINPDLVPVLKTCTGTGNFDTYSSNLWPKCSCSDASSTKMISSRSSLGDLNIMECIVLNKVVQASL